MATETPTKGILKMDMNPPPAYRGKDRTKLYVTALTVIAVTILVGFFGIFYLLLSSPAPSVVNTVTNEIEAGKSTTIEREIIYEIADGTEHVEKVTAQGDAITIRGVGDGFIAIFDQSRKLVVFKNTTSGGCYFTRLENFPDVNMENMDEMRPVYFQETNQTAEITTDPNVVVLTFDQSASIPPEYIDLTNSDIVTSQCVDGAYWANLKEGQVKKRFLPVVIFVVIVLVPTPAY